MEPVFAAFTHAFPSTGTTDASSTLASGRRACHTCAKCAIKHDIAYSCPLPALLHNDPALTRRELRRDMASTCGRGYSRCLAHGKNHTHLALSLLSTPCFFTINGLWCSCRCPHCPTQEGSPYQLRERYVGEWVEGQRKGRGTFYFASGAIEA